MRKAWIIVGCLCLLLFLVVGLTAMNGIFVLPPLPSAIPAALGIESTPPPTPATTPEPAPTEEPSLWIGGVQVPLSARSLRLDAPDDEALQLLCAMAPTLTALEELRVDGAVLTPERALALRDAFPDTSLHYTLSLLGQDCPSDLGELTLRDPAELEADRAWLPQLDRLLPALSSIRIPAGDEFSLSPEEERFPLETLSALREELPESVELQCRFRLFGMILSSADEEVYYEKAGLRQGDLDTVRLALPLLTSCRRFVLDNCGPCYEDLAALRDEFPERNIVWRVHLNQDSLLTDETVLWSIYVRDENCHVLNYCTELQYIDLGHDEWLSDISFTAYMPKLKVLIIALTAVTDISPLANCPELEYLEIFRTDISDLSPLVHCQKLEHLNISSMVYVTDISPLYELKNLKRLWTIFSSRIPQEQKDEIRRRLPDCEFRFYGDDCTANGWRFDVTGLPVERYALLKEQMGYNGYNTPADKIDWSKSWQPGYA